MRDPPNPAVKEFIDLWVQTFKEKFGEGYVVNGGKDGALVKKMLAIHSLDKLKEFCRAFYGSDDPFIKDSGYTIGAFYSQLNKLVARGGGW